MIIGPEQLVTKNIQQLIANPGALQVLDFADGRVQLVAVRAFHDGLIVGQELQEIRKHMPNVDTRVAAIFRQDRPIIPGGRYGGGGRRRGVLYRRPGEHPRR